MKLPRILSTLVIAAGCVGVCASEQKKEDEIRLAPFVSTAYWQDFTVSKEFPVSDDGQYRLKEVRKNGDVELLLVQERGEVSIIVKPKPKKLKEGKPVPMIVVLEANPTKQSARLSELRLK